MAKRPPYFFNRRGIFGNVHFQGRITRWAPREKVESRAIAEVTRKLQRRTKRPSTGPGTAPPNSPAELNKSEESYHIVHNKTRLRRENYILPEFENNY